MSSSNERIEGPARARRRTRTAIVIAQRVAIGLAWALTVALAAALGWFGGRLSAPAGARQVESTPALWTYTEAAPHGVPVEPAVTERVRAEPALPAEESRDNAPEPEVKAQSAAVSAPPSLPEIPSPPAQRPTVEIEPEVPEAVAEVPEVVLPRETITDRAARLERFAAAADLERTHDEAEALLNDYDDYSGLTAAFVAQGADELHAQLDALRVLQLGGLESVSTNLARELKRSYASTPEVLEKIRDWRILKPRITTLDSSIETERVVVNGELENPDVGAIRRVFVEVEALDAGGNVIAKERARVRPKVIDADGTGSFSVTFGDVDPSFVLRTRATVVEWQSEVL